MIKNLKKGYWFFLLLIFILFFPQKTLAQYAICSCSWFDVVCWLSCILQYIFTLPIRLLLLFVALLGLVVGYIGLFLGFKIIPGLVNDFIIFSLSSDKYLGGSVISVFEKIRGLAFGFLALFLAIIALATIFKVAEYEARRALVPLIIVALLLNFSFVITKTIIKFGNSLTYTIKDYFFSKIEGGGFFNLEDHFNQIQQIYFNRLGDVWQIFIADGDIAAFFTEKPSSNNPNLKGPIIILIALIAAEFWVLAFFTIFFGLCIGLFGLIFLIRIAFLVCLAVTAPIAFVTAIFRTKELRSIFPTPLNWDGWWETLLQWTFIGIPLIIWAGVALLFLDPNFTIPVSQTDEPIKILIATLLPFLVAGVTIFIGATTSPGLMGGFAKSLFGTVTGFVGGAIASAAVIGGVAVTRGAKLVRRGAEKIPKVGPWIEKKVPPGLITRMEKGVGEIGAGLEKAGLLPKPIAEFGRRYAKWVTVPKGDIEKLSPEEREKKFKSPLTPEETKMTIAQVMAEKGEFKRAEDVYWAAKRGVDIKSAIKARPEFLDHEKFGEEFQSKMVPKGKEDEDVKRLIGIGVSEKEAIKKAAFKKAVDAAKREDIDKWTRETLENENVQEMIVRFKSWDFIRRLGEKKGLDYLDKLQEKAEKIGIEEITKTNRSFARAPYTPAGSLYLRPWKKKPIPPGQKTLEEFME